jgi:nucleotide-binding universal stress UspA family protein
MRNQVTTLQQSPPSEEAFRAWAENQNTPLVADKDRSPGFSGSARVHTNQESGRPIRRILVPTDFSPCSARALERAVALAQQTDATLTILHVIDINPPAARTHCGTAEELMRQLWVTGTSELARLKKSLEENQIRSQTLVVEGLPCEAIVENSSDFDLLVISEPRLKSGWDFFWKHTTQRVIEQAECPVHVVHQETGPVDRISGSKAKVAA